MKTKMIISAIAMLAVLAAAFAMVSAEDSDAEAADTQITGYGETTGLKAIYYHDGKLLLDIAAFNAPNVDVKVTYTGGSNSPQTFTALTTGKVGIELGTGISKIDSIEVFAHGTTTSSAKYTLSNIAISDTVYPIKFNLNESSLLASAPDSFKNDVTFVRYASMPTDTKISGCEATLSKWQYADGTDVTSTTTVEDLLFTYGKDVTLKAVWDPTNVVYKVKFDSNVGTTVTGASAVPGTVAGVAYASHVISDAKLVMTSTDYDFNGWNTAADGSGTTYPVDTSSTPSITVSKLHYLTNTEVTLYAMWTIKTYDVTFANDTKGSYYFTDESGNAIYSETVDYGGSISFKLVQETTFYKGNKVLDNGTEITPGEGGVYTISAVSAAHAVTFSNAAMVGKISFDTVWNAEIGTTGEFKINLVNGSSPGDQVAKVKASSFVSYGSYGLLSVTKLANSNDYTYTILSKTTGAEEYAAASYIIQVSPTTWRVDFAAIEAPVTLKITAAGQKDATLEKFFIDSINGGTVTISIMDDYAFPYTNAQVLLEGTIYKEEGGIIWYSDAQTGQTESGNKTFTISPVSEISYEYSGTVTVKSDYLVYAAQATWNNDSTLMVIA